MKDVIDKKVFSDKKSMTIKIHMAIDNNDDLANDGNDDLANWKNADLINSVNYGLAIYF